MTPALTESVSPRQRLVMFWLIGLTFLLMGLVQASYGPSFAGFEARFQVSELQVARIYTATFAAMFVSILGSGPLIRRLGLRAALVLALILMLAGLVAMALAPSWPLLLMGAFVVGLGYGAVTVVGNFSLARIGARALLNLANALFGVGAITGPLAVAWLAPHGVTTLYGLLALGVLGVLLASRAFPDGGRERPAPGEARGRAPLLALGLLNLLLFLYVALEVSASGWMARHLAPHYGLTRASALVSVFWVAYTLGRVLSAPVAQRVAPGRLTALCFAACLPLALLTSVPALQLAAYALLGFAMSPIYMSAVAWLVTLVPARFVNLGLLGSGIGAAFGPVLVGLLLTDFGVVAIGPALAGLAALGLLVTFTVRALVQRERPLENRPGGA